MKKNMRFSILQYLYFNLNKQNLKIFLSLWVFIIITLFFISISVSISRNNLTKKKILLQVNKIAPELHLSKSESFTILAEELTNQILPPLAPSEIKNESSILRIPSDLLGFSNILFVHQMIYPHILCLFVKNKEKNASEVLIFSLSKDDKKITRLLDRVIIGRGTTNLLTRLNSHFVSEAEKKIISFSALKIAINNPESVKAIKSAISRHKETRLTEKGGFMTISYEVGKKPLLHFYFVVTEGEEFIEKFKKASHDWRIMYKLMKENPAEFAIIPYQYRACLNTYSLNISVEKKKQRFQSFADLFLYMSKNTYCPDAVRYIETLADKKVSGYYVGDFHVHPFENDASFQDKQNSAFQRVLILIPRKGGFDLVDLVHVNPYRKPKNVIEYRGNF